MITDILHMDNVFDDLPIADRKKQRQAALQAKVDAYFASTFFLYRISAATVVTRLIDCAATMVEPIAI